MLSKNRIIKCHHLCVNSEAFREQENPTNSCCELHWLWVRQRLLATQFISVLCAQTIHPRYTHDTPTIHPHTGSGARPDLTPAWRHLTPGYNILDTHFFLSCYCFNVFFLSLILSFVRSLVYFFCSVGFSLILLSVTCCQNVSSVVNKPQ